jgi:hypothetical protein
MNRRHVGLVVLSLVAVATTGMLAPVLGNHLAAGDTGEIEISVVETHLSETDTETVLAATLRIQNPTTRPLVVPETVAYNELGIRYDGAILNKRRVTEIDRSRIPAGETGTAQFRFAVKDQYADRIDDLREDAQLSGQVPFRLDGNTIAVEVDVPLAGGDA